jgi:hypothetical protein
MIYPIRTEIEILPADPAPPKSTRRLHSYIIINSSGKTQLRKPRGLKLGWTIEEKIGIAIVNRRAISKSKITKLSDEI